MARQYGIRSRINQPSSLTEIQITEAEFNDFITNNFNSTIFRNWVNNYLLGSPPVDGDGLFFDSASNSWLSHREAISWESIRKPNRYYSSNLLNYGGLGGVYNLIKDKIQAMPFLVPVAQSFDRLGVLVPNNKPDSELRLGLYDDNGHSYPGELVVDSGILLTDTTGLKEVNINETLGSGLYWLVIIGTNAGMEQSVRNLIYCRVSPQMGWPLPLLTTDFPDFFYEIACPYDALPENFPAEAEMKHADDIPAIFLRKKDAIP